MGDFVFSRPFNMLSQQEWHHIVALLQRALSLLGPLSPVPWLIHIAFKLFPRVWVLRDWFRMVSWCEGQMLDQLKVSTQSNIAIMELADSNTVAPEHLEDSRRCTLPLAGCSREHRAVSLADW